MRRAVLALILLAACSEKTPTPQKPRPATLRARANAWLLDHQRPDGSWKSDVYNGNGASMTAFALFALTRAPDFPKPAVARGLDWLRARIGPDGRVAADDYPTYATACAIMAFVAAKPPDWKDDVARMADGLKQLQLNEANGWSPDDPGYGGWDGGLAIPKKPMHGQVDISVTTFALEALKDAGDPLPSSAVTFWMRCDGLFTPIPELAFKNKAGSGVRYGTAMMDYFRTDALLGTDTLTCRGEKMPGPTELPKGFPEEGEAAQWAEGLRFYYAYQCARNCGYRTVAEWLAKSERPGGGWSNDFALMREDDPLIATGLAAAALNLLYSQSRK